MAILSVHVHLLFNNVDQLILKGDYQLVVCILLREICDLIGYFENEQVLLFNLLVHCMIDGYLRFHFKLCQYKSYR